jgi:hypothetical protein
MLNPSLSVNRLEVRDSSVSCVVVKPLYVYDSVLSALDSLTFGWDAFIRGRLFFLLHWIRHSQLVAKKDSSFMVPISSVLLKSMLGRDYLEFVNFLVENGLLEVNKTYRRPPLIFDKKTGKMRKKAQNELTRFDKEGVCRKYRITKKFRSSGYKLVNGFKVRWRHTKPKGMTDELFNLLRESLSLVTFDENKVKKELDSLESEKKAQAEHALDMFKRGDFNIVSGKKSGRAFHAATSLRKNLRKAMYINGEQVAEVDVSASQFLLLHTLYPKKTDESERFRARVENGEIYNDFMHLFPHLNRGDVKMEAIKFLFDRSFVKKREVMSHYFDENYPELSEQIRLAKKYDHRKLAIDLQKKESRAFIDNVVVKLYKMGIHAIPIHDCVIVQRKYAEIADKMIKDIIWELYQLRAKTKISVEI